MIVEVIGTGSIGCRHIRNLRAAGHEVLAVDGAFESLAAARQAGATSVNTQPFALDAVEAILICTPIWNHAVCAEHLLNSGYAGPLFVEKALTPTLSDATIFRSWPHPTTMVGYNWRFHPLVRNMRSDYEALGRPLIRETTLWVICDCTAWPGANYGSDLLECSHEIDLDLYMHGGGALQLDAAEANGVWELRIKRASGAASQITIDAHAVGQYDRGCTLECEGYALRYHVGAAERGLVDQSYVDEIQHFLRCAEVGIETACGFVDGLAVVAVCEEAEKSAGRTTLR